ncbi:hypothetical protein EJ07DRAFT_74254, partial [Lizonia empirigonia]
FAPLAQNYSGAVTQHLHDSQGISGVPKSDFFMLFWRSWQQTFTKELILSAFENTGIWPLNPNVVLSRWDDVSDSEYETPPPIKAHDWRSIDRLYKAVVGENTSDDARQLRRTIHHLSASCGILTAENKGLSAAVAAQNPLKKKRETLDLRQRKKGRSEALYSPSRASRQRRAEEAADRERKKQERDVAKSIQLSQSGKRKASQ